MLITVETAAEATLENEDEDMALTIGMSKGVAAAGGFVVRQRLVRGKCGRARCAVAPSLLALSLDLENRQQGKCTPRFPSGSPLSTPYHSSNATRTHP